MMIGGNIGGTAARPAGRETVAASFFLGHGDAQGGLEAGQSLADLVERAVEEHLHALLAGGLAELVERGPLLDELGEPGRDPDDLEDADPAAVAQPPALQAALGAVDGLARR